MCIPKHVQSLRTFTGPPRVDSRQAVVPVGVCVRVPCSVEGVMLTRAELELCLCTRWFFNNNSLIDTAPVYREGAVR